MFDFLKKKKPMTPDANEITSESATDPTSKNGFFNKLKNGLAKTRSNLTSGLANLFLGKKELSPELISEIEMHLLTADVGIETTEALIQSLTQKLARKELKDNSAVFQCLKQEMKAILKLSNQPLKIPETIKPFVILVVGINGSGKTTTIGKMAYLFKQDHKNILLAAGDTFRAAAIEQLHIWADRNEVPIIAQQAGADTAAVIYDALEAAKARGSEILIADTAGRLHTQTNLMAELQKVKRVLTKLDPTAPHETLLVLDATLGQNTFSQVKQFREAIGISGIVLTKLDGTAKGGIVFALAKSFGIPIRFIGLGEKINDLRPFDADDFVDALFTD